jgi:hypothetical protein
MVVMSICRGKPSVAFRSAKGDDPANVGLSATETNEDKDAATGGQDNHLIFVTHNKSWPLFCFFSFFAMPATCFPREATR